MHSISAVTDIAATPQQVCAVLAAGDLRWHESARARGSWRAHPPHPVRDLPRCPRPLTSKIITKTEPDFRSLNQALKQRVERAAVR
jgi:hypothetical protein